MTRNFIMLLGNAGGLYYNVDLMKERIHHLAVASVAELKEKLAPKESTRGYQFIALSLEDPNVSVYPFSLAVAPRAQFIARLIEEAVSLSSLNKDDIKLEYQVFGTKDGTAEGVFACISVRLLQEYISVCDKAGLIPVHFTPGFLARVGEVFEKRKKETDRFAVLDFVGDDRVNVGVFSNGACEFLRRIRYENPEEARSEILQSLRSASAKSQSKTIARIYAATTKAGHQQVLGLIGKNTGAQITEEPLAQEPPHDTGSGYFQLNLLRDHSFALARRRQFTLAARALIGVLLALVLINGIRLISTHREINNIRSSYQPADVEYARSLQKRLDSLPK